MYDAAIKNQHNLLEKSKHVQSLYCIWSIFVFQEKACDGISWVMDMLLVVGVQITLINSSRHNKGEVILYKKIGALLLKEQMSTTNVLRGEPREEIQ